MAFNNLQGFQPNKCPLSLFGEKGKHARSAVGMYALPMGMAVEIEIIVELEN